MIIYHKSKKEFLEDMLLGEIDSKIFFNFVKESGKNVGQNEQRSWRESMNYVSRVIDDKDLPDDTGIAIEYHIPGTSNRIDFIITGKDYNQKPSAVIIELKQWSKGVSMTDEDAILNTNFFGKVPHPSYQAWSYTSLIRDFNENVEKYDIKLSPCAYLHNYLDSDNIISNNFYKEHLEKAPVFYKTDAIKLRNFIKKYVKYGDSEKALYLIENGKIRPSKSLSDVLSSLLKGNKEFILIDSQKLVYEKALKLARELKDDSKAILIVEGGPGTGKSILAINLLSDLIRKGLNARYVTKNSAPRLVYEAKLTGKFLRSEISNLFSSSGTFYDTKNNTFDVLIVDEAHRLNAQSGLYSNKGVNQIKEIIYSAKLTIFFIDEDQRVTLKDIGKSSEIYYWASSYEAEVHKSYLESQFRCNGSDGYLAWLDNTLQIKKTANQSLEEINYDFKIVDSPEELHNIIKQKNQNNKARVVAGYCWNWISKKDKRLFDIEIGDYRAKWNLSNHGQTWIIHPKSVSEIGCIHTTQGLELEYVGVIVGPDLIYRNGLLKTDPEKRAKTDQSLKGFKKQLKEDPIFALKRADEIIKNTYRTLMTRGQKGCYVYFVDSEIKEYFKNALKKKELKNNSSQNILFLTDKNN